MFAKVIDDQPKLKLIVRLTTSVFKQGERYVFQKSIHPLKSKSSLSFHDVVGDETFDLPHLLDGNVFKDGLYELTATNISRDYETGMIDGWDLKLMPHDTNVNKEN